MDKNVSRKAWGTASILKVPQATMAQGGQPTVDKVRASVKNARPSLGDVPPSTAGGQPMAVNVGTSTRNVQASSARAAPDPSAVVPL